MGSANKPKLASVSLQLASDSSFARKTLEKVQRDVNADGETVFSSSEGLYDGIYTLDAYLAPLFGSLVPAICAFSATRMLGVIVYSLGQPLAGSRGGAAELLHLLPSQGPNQKFQYSFSESNCIIKGNPMVDQQT